MEIHNQIFYTTLCSCVLSLTGESQTVKFHSELYISDNLHFYSLSFCLFSSFMVGFDIWYLFRSYHTRTTITSSRVCVSP